MSKQALIELLTYVEPLVCAFALLLMQQRRQLRQFTYLAAFLGTRLATFAILLPVLHVFARYLSVQVSYQIYFYVYWFSYAVEACLGLGIIYSIYKLAMAPLKGLQRLGIPMFRWAGGIAIALAVTMAFGPHVTGTRFIMRAVTQLQQTQSVLTLCMLFFVCLAIRPMGLSHRSKIFGVSLGLGVLATADLIGSAWLSGVNMVSVFAVLNGVSICLAVAIWMTYFAIPEPKRRMIILPTTSPFLRWNQISLALGDEPGYVAVGEVSPEMFAPAEIEVMRRASLKMVNILGM